jgi:transposase-like protein
MRITTATSLDQIPDTQPGRYINSNGYWRLRWRVASGEYVECYEHRFVAGLPAKHLHVHHRNHDKTDNRASNLEVMTRQEHIAHHKSEAEGKWPEVLSLYESGLSMPQVANKVGMNHGTISRILKRSGVAARAARDYFEVGVDRDEAVRQVMSGVPVPQVSKALGVSPATVRRLAREAGWRGKGGRPRVEAA